MVRRTQWKINQNAIDLTQITVRGARGDMGEVKPYCAGLPKAPEMKVD